MWKISRNLIFPRWHASKQSSVETKPKKKPVCPKLVVAYPFEKKRYSDDSQKKKENFHKESKRFWNCEQFLFRPLIFETAGWLGAVTVLCFNYHVKYFNSFYKDNVKKYCIFSKNVLAMPETPAAQDQFQSKVLLPEKKSSTEQKEIKDRKVNTESNFAEDFSINAGQYIAALQNSAGMKHLDSNNKKAFRHFQAAARLGSGQALYNLGLCYELGKGTKVNLNRAAFCYRKAAMKGHGLASFNLAIFFLKGLGGLPIDPDTAKLLLAEAADQNVPEAQIYMGIEYLEENKWSQAFEVFDDLAKRNNLDGKYYLGLCYANGWGVNRDEKVATELFSYAAALGHAKSLLKLSKCYEEGFGSCESNLDFAEALCQIPADQGNEEALKAMQRIQIKKENLCIKDAFELCSTKLQKTNMHTSTSFPELTANKLLKSKTLSFTSSYFNIPPLSFKTSSLHENKKPTFFIGDDNLALNLSPTYMPCYQSNLLLMAEKA